MATSGGYPDSVSQTSTGLPSWASLSGWRNNIYTSSSYPTVPYVTPKETSETVHCYRDYGIPAGATPTGLYARVRCRATLDTGTPDSTSPSIWFQPSGGAASSQQMTTGVSSTELTWPTSMHSLTTSEWWDIADGTSSVRFFCRHYPLQAAVSQWQVWYALIYLTYTLPPDPGTILMVTL